MLGNIGKMMKLAAAMKTRLPEMQEELAATEYSAEAGRGAVVATVNGKLRLVNVKINQELLAERDLDAVMLEDLITAAIVSAQDKAAEAVKAAMAELTDGMELPPGLMP